MKNVAGVKAIAASIKVDYGNSFRKSDTEIANEVLRAWKWEVSNDDIKVKVEDGWVSLEGELKWNYQREEAKRSIENIAGVKGVSNNISIKSESKDVIEKEALENAFERSWFINNNHLNVNVVGNRVKLTGTVHSLYQKEEAGRLAWNAPGVCSVDNELLVEYN